MIRAIIVGLTLKMSKDEFYIILPSNSNPMTQPNNTANHFVVEWEETIQLAEPEKWTVALIEMSYYHSPYTVNQKFGFQFTSTEFAIKPVLIEIKRQLNSKITFGIKCTEADEIDGFTDIWPLPKTMQMKNGKLRFVSKSKFAFNFYGIDDAVMFGFPRTKLSVDDLLYDDKQKVFYFESSSKPIDLFEIGVHRKEALITFYGEPTLESNEIKFEKFYLFPNPQDLAAQIENIGKVSNCLEKCYYDETVERIYFTVKDHIIEFKLLDRLAFVLGFRKNIFDCNATKTFYGDFEPELKSAANVLYIYASCVKQSHVGQHLYPILKTVCIDGAKHYTENDIRNVVIKNPMYIPLNTSALNGIEIEIRDDVGAYFPFASNAKTSLTLHFKKQ
jgi:hypothetical protein